MSETYGQVADAILKQVGYSDREHGSSIIDNDGHFVIDPITRIITNKSGKREFVQYDHNSERLTFEVPKIIEGHDMSTSIILIQYIVGANKGIYEVDDAKVEGDMLVFSWLISSNVTQQVANVNFVITFECLGDDDRVVYNWNTKINKELSVIGGISNQSTLLYEYADVLEQWKQQIKKSVSDGKVMLADAITSKGVETASDCSFAEMAEHIKNIQTDVAGKTQSNWKSSIATDTTISGIPVYIERS